MKKLLILTGIMCIFGLLTPVQADTMNYKIRYDGDSMVIVPYYSNKKLPKGKNRTRTV